FEISSVDSQTSHVTINFPGLVNVAAFVPNISVASNDDFDDSSKASLGGGFTTISVLPTGLAEFVQDNRTMALAQDNSRGHAHTDYILSVAATSDNAPHLDQVITEAAALFI